MGRGSEWIGGQMLGGPSRQGDGGNWRGRERAWRARNGARVSDGQQAEAGSRMEDKGQGLGTWLGVERYRGRKHGGSR